MATYNSIERSKHATLVAATVDTINFVEDGVEYEIVNLSAVDDLYARLDGTAPTVAGDETILVRKGESVTRRTARTAQVKLISSGAPEYHVERLD